MTNARGTLARLLSALQCKPVAASTRAPGAGTAAGIWRRFARCETGSAAAEFGFLAAPFLALTFLVLNTGLVFIAQQSLQTATTQVARLIMTGQVQQQGMTASQFQQAVCANVTSLFNCSGIYVNVQTFTSFSAMSNSMLNPVQNGSFNQAKMGFSAGVSGDIEVVQVFYQWPLYATLLGFDFSNLSGGMDLLVATAAFRNEPY